jgi:amino acid permease
MNHMLTILVENAHELRVSTLQDLVMEACGPAMYAFMSGVIFVYSFGSCVAYLIVIGDMLPPVMSILLGEGSVLASREFLIIVRAVACRAPCSAASLFVPPFDLLS